MTMIEFFNHRLHRLHGFHRFHGFYRFHGYSAVLQGRSHNLCNLWSLLFLSLCLVSCDSGDIEERTYSSSSKGQSVKLTATVMGADTWNSQYTVALAGFKEGSNYAVMQYATPTATAENGTSGI